VRATVLIIGGAGRIGQQIAADLMQYSSAQMILTGRRANPRRSLQPLLQRSRYQSLDLDDQTQLNPAIAAADLVIHAAGPFHERDLRVLQSCIHHKVPYLDVCDQRRYTAEALALHEQARVAGITAVIGSGIFPGISNSLVKQDVEQLETCDRIHLSYGVGGSGGAGKTVMQTTFLALQHPFSAWLQGQWHSVRPYSEGETIAFPAPFGSTQVFWFDMPEALTLPESFQGHTVITKFGSVPNLYNVLTQAVAHLPSDWLQNKTIQDILAWGAFTMTQLSDRWSGIGVAIRSEVKGLRGGVPTTVCSTVVHPNTAIAAGAGAGMMAAELLKKSYPTGVFPIERCLETPEFQCAMQQRNIDIRQTILE
jgi:saccharopine dehydrogenase-like NADP-dependent oxidoreductase